MPIARIEVRKSWPADQRQRLIDALHAAMVEALRVPERDRQIRFVEHRPENFAVPPESTESYTLVELSLYPGRSLEAKRSFYQGVVKRFGELGIEPSDIFIVLNEVPKDNWGIRGGVPGSEVDPGSR